jgi:serine/threonine protein kinase
MKSIRYLPKKRHSNRGGGTKYFIDCSLYSRQPEKIKTEILLRNVENQNVAIIKAIASDDTIKKKNKQIVIKISQHNGLSLKEYLIGELLYNHHLSGFIQYICIFKCYDDTAKKAPKITQIQPSKPYNIPINAHRSFAPTAFLRMRPRLQRSHISSCDAEPTNQNLKDVLVMPYITEGSLENYHWTNSNIAIYKNLIIHIFLSLATAYYHVKLIHGDLHLGNILIKKTKLTTINYQLSNEEDTIIVPTMGYKIVIMDFEKSRTEPMEIPDNIYRWDNPPPVTEFWKEILFLFKNKMDTPFEKYEDFLVIWENNDIINYIKNYITKNNAITNNNIIPLLNLIEQSVFSFTPIEKYSYNPDIF